MFRQLQLDEARDAMIDLRYVQAEQQLEVAVQLPDPRLFSLLGVALEHAAALWESVGLKKNI